MNKDQRSAHNFSRHNRIRLVHGGAEFFHTLKEMIDRAEQVVHIQVYIFDEDSTGKRIGESLMAAARRGVAVFLLADGFASQNLSRNYIRQLKEAGIHFRYFEPLLRSTRFYFGRRLHQKSVVVDGLHALVGGVNIADRYNDVDEIPSWLDYAVYLEGEAALQLHQFSEGFWKEHHPHPLPPGKLSSFISSIHSRESASVRLRRNDWVKGKHEIWKTYFNMFHQAEENITIMCSYFLPGRVLRKQLGKAAKRGVDIKVILAGPTDVPIAKYAERYLYNWMLKSGIRIFEYQPTVLHAKVAIADGRRVTIGSFNVNNISAYASLELNVEIRNRHFALHLEKEINEKILPQCEEITNQNFATNATLFKRFLNRAAYELIRVILNLTTFYFKHE